jgi:FixJ family two-component response regulator
MTIASSRFALDQSWLRRRLDNGRMSAPANTVLVVDDDAAVRASLKFALEVEGFQVKLYDRGAALLADANLPEHACLVVDYRMPDIDGIELIERLSRLNVTLPAILITVRVTKQLRLLAQRLGLAAVLEKPLSDSELVESIRRALASKS